MKDRLRKLQDPAGDKWNRENFRHFDFDLLLTNLPFAGDIKEPRILHQYDPAKDGKGKFQRPIGRDILFIERNLEFPKPGGHAAIVLPQRCILDAISARQEAARLLGDAKAMVENYTPR